MGGIATLIRFKDYLGISGINPILAGVKHPQTKEKLERLLKQPKEFIYESENVSVVFCSNISIIGRVTFDIMYQVNDMTKKDLEEVIGYQFQYRVKEQKVNLHVKTKESGWIKKPVDVLPLEKAVFLIDMLRNEKPIYYHTVEGAIQTLGELVGEKE